MSRHRLSLFLVVTILVLAALACNSSPAPVVPTEVPPADTPAGDTAPTAAVALAPTDTVVAPTEVPASETPVVDAGCTLDAGYVADVTIPDDTILAPNTPFVKTWRIRNRGTCEWTVGTQFAYLSGDPLGGPVAVDVSPTAAGADVDVSVSFTAPAAPGTYRSNWQVQSPEGTRFGSFYVQIVVPEPPTLTPTNVPAPADPPTPTSTPTLPAPPPPSDDWGRLYRRGDQGTGVYAIQYLLRAAGHTLTPDGLFGAQTESAVKSFQQAKGLTADGVVGPDTWTALVQGRTVRSGSTGDAVRAAQYVLNHGYGRDEVAVDGQFGAKTDTAVREFQQSRGLTVDGVVGPQTWKALMSGL